jgi:hypothetical protein
MYMASRQSIVRGGLLMLHSSIYMVSINKFDIIVLIYRYIFD